MLLRGTLYVNDLLNRIGPLKWKIWNKTKQEMFIKKSEHIMLPVLYITQHSCSLHEMLLECHGPVNFFPDKDYSE